MIRCSNALYVKAATAFSFIFTRFVFCQVSSNLIKDLIHFFRDHCMHKIQKQSEIHLREYLKW
jgi:hypothetical protein